MEELVKTIRGRPSSVPFDGGIIWVAIHDQHYLRQRKEFLEKIKQFHPDRNHKVTTGYMARMILQIFLNWRKKEVKWYSQFSLEPPKP